MTIKEMIEAFFRGELYQAYHLFGAHFTVEEGISGVRFCVYAPNAQNVQVASDFNCWEGSNTWMTKIDDRGIWEVFVPSVSEYTKYKYNIETYDNGWIQKSDPYAFYSELRPMTSSKIVYLDEFEWTDDKWIKERETESLYEKAVNIYEMHLGSWMNKGDDYYSYTEIADPLIDYLRKMEYTHVEFMPLSEHPFDGSWGYQVTGYFSVTSRYGNPKQFMELVNRLHENGIGVIMDWVPVHFCKDAHGLIDFDGGTVFEYPFDDLKENEQWGTRQFDLGNPVVRQFLISSVNFWADYYHLDGVRVDAVSYMIYYLGNTDRGINEAGVEFLKTFNKVVHAKYPGFVTIAEDSSAYPNVTEPVFNGGLGFDFKWDLGWMNDVLKFMGQSYEDRTLNYNPLTFGMMYRYSDKYILPFSHDEVVHGKGSIVNKMYGTYEEKFANLRMLFGYMYAYPSKVLNFMGNEIAQFSEWDEAKQIEWEMKKYPLHDSVARYVRDLNIVYKFNEALFSKDTEPDGFVWSEVHKPHDGIYVFIRRGHLDKDIVVICNFKDKDYYDYRFGVLQDGGYTEIINSDDTIYGGSGMVNTETIFTEKVEINGKEDSIKIHIPKLSTIYLLKE